MRDKSKTTHESKSDEPFAAIRRTVVYINCKSGHKYCCLTTEDMDQHNTSHPTIYCKQLIQLNVKNANLLMCGRSHTILANIDFMFKTELIRDFLFGTFA